mgnify:CR=1 FL=1
MFEISKYKKSNVKISIRLPENMNDTLKKIAKKENMSFNNVIVSCIQNSLDEMDLNKYKNIEISEPKEVKIEQNREKTLKSFLYFVFNNLHSNY